MKTYYKIKDFLLSFSLKETLNRLRKNLAAKDYRQIIALSVLAVAYVLNSIIAPIKYTQNASILSPITQVKKNGGYEVFGFAPYWTFNKLDNVDFNVLTTFAYFGVPVDVSGNLTQDDPGYQTFVSRHATDIFTKAHEHGTRVVLTLTQMDNGTIQTFLENPDAQDNAINQAIYVVKSRGIDGINIDFEYSGNPGPEYRNKFSSFVEKMSQEMHNQLPDSKVTVSVYAAAAKDPMIYDVASLANSTDGLFMMAYDFAVAGSDYAMPTAPLSGHEQGKYWYDINSAVNDFLKEIPSEKLILGVPYYGYNYPVYQPNKVKSPTLYYYPGNPQTYSDAQNNITPSNPEVQDYKSGWDNDGKVGWKSYYDTQTGTWRMLFLEDVKSLGLKYDFAKSKNLKGVGIWALGFDDDKPELWTLLQKEFGPKLANNSIDKNINDNI